MACLLAVMSRKAWLPLARGQRFLCEPPQTVGDVLDLYARDQLSDITGLGPRRIAEIEAALVLAGFGLFACRHSVPGRDQARQQPGTERPRS